MIPVRLASPVLLLMIGSLFAHPMHAGCRCHGKHQRGRAAPFPVHSPHAVATGVAPYAYGPDLNIPAPVGWHGPDAMQPHPHAMPETGLPAEPAPRQWHGQQADMPPVSRDDSPPPGTIGRTYQLRSKPVPVDMHPRVALLDVYVPDATNVFVHDINPYRTQDRLDGFQDAENPDMWHFETEPLYPGLPRIYRIEAQIPGEDGPRMEERYVRLIMGRVLELRF